MTEKLKTLSDLKSEMKIYKILLQNYGLKYETVEDFLNQFGLETEEEILSYILNLENGYALSKYGHRNDRIYAYNGKSYYQGTKSTLGASHHSLSH